VRRAIMMSAALLATLLLGVQSGAAAARPPGKSAPTPDQLPQPRPAGPGVAALTLVGDGFLDVAVGAPREDVGAKADAGAVDVLLGFLEGTGDLGSGSFTLTQGSNAEPGDLFGATLAAGDLTPDDHPLGEDLAVGAPGENLGTVADAGAVNVFTSDEGGLLSPMGRTLTQSGLNERGDRFGATLAASFQNNDDTEDLVVGIPGEDAGTRIDAGAVNAFNGSPTGQLSNGRLFTQFVNVESGDGFGAALGGLFPAL
jgi:FG-GAP repeat